jgi:hypothetical protein
VPHTLRGLSHRGGGKRRQPWPSSQRCRSRLVPPPAQRAETAASGRGRGLGVLVPQSRATAAETSAGAIATPVANIVSPADPGASRLPGRSLERPPGRDTGPECGQHS